MTNIADIAKQARDASHVLALLTESKKNDVLRDMAAAIRSEASTILQVNIEEVQRAKTSGLSASMVDRLTLTDARIEAMAAGIDTLIQLPDPVGELRELSKRPNGINVQKMRVPLGVVCMIYEARPNVTADAGALCFKSGNSVILRGGKEALDTSLAIARIMQSVLAKHDLPEALISVVPNPDRALMMELMQQRDYIDVIIPRGGEGLIQFVTDNSKVPVIQHFKGVCHLYVDKDADVSMALDLLENGKTQRTGVCNALECLLVHKDIAEAFYPKAAALLNKHDVKVHAESSDVTYFEGATVIAEGDFGEEYLALEIAVKTVDSFADALSHIQTFGSHHTEVICTDNQETAKQFLHAVDASVVMVNASSRFSDGSELGLGAEIGIATTKLHAYGPMGLESLTTEKFIVSGEGQVRG